MLLDQEPGNSWLTDFLISVIQPPYPYTQSSQCPSSQSLMQGDVLDFSGQSFNFAELHSFPTSYDHLGNVIQNFEQDFASGSTSQNVAPEASMQNGITLGSKEFQPSFWSIDPFQANSRRHPETPHSDIPPNMNESDISCEGKHPQAVSIDVSSTARDHLIALILSLSEDSSLQSTVSLMSSFPSTSILAELTNQSLSNHLKRVDSFIHTTTFEPSQQFPELWVGLIASAALKSVHPSLRQFGLFLHEAHRALNNKLVRCALHTSVTQC